MGLSREEKADLIRRRKERILAYISQDPPVPVENIMAMEGMTLQPLRQIISELEKEHGIKYFGTPGARMGSELPYGLTDSTARLRSKLGDYLYRVTQQCTGRPEAASIVGLNPREQIRAESKPFAHDWTLSQIERLARTLGEDPREFLLRCLTT